MDEHRSHPSPSHTRREAGVIQRVRASLRRAFPDDATPNILIGCSGGRDSIALASMLHALVRTGSIRADLIHVDHAFRDDSPLAASLVRQFGASLGMDVHVQTLAPGVLSRHPGTGAEEALRRERYAAFAQAMRETGADAVALAHHEQDQAETVLLHLMRGAGLRGASAMREWSGLTVPWWDTDAEPQTIRIWRPLLAEPVSVIEEWRQANGLPVAEDATNEDRRYRRNAVRHDILPALEAIVPGAVSNLARFAGIAAADDDLLDAIAAERLGNLSDGRLERQAIADVATPISRRVIRQWLAACGFDGDLSADRIEAVRLLAERNRGGAAVELVAGWRVRIDSGVLSLLPPQRVP